MRQNRRCGQNAVENTNDISIPIAITAMVALPIGDIIYSIKICSYGLNVGYRESKASYNLSKKAIIANVHSNTVSTNSCYATLNGRYNAARKLIC